MNLNNLLKGKNVSVKTDVGVDVTLAIQSVKEHRENKSEDLEPSTRENDWWPAQRTWTEYWINVTFTNGHTKRYNSLDDIKLSEETP